MPTNLTSNSNVTATFATPQEIVINKNDDSIGVFGTDGSTQRQLKTDSDGELQVDVLSSSLPTGAATAAKQDSIEAAILGLKNTYSSGNSSTSPLNAAAIFTGTGEEITQFNSVCVAVKTDQDGTLYIEFSPDNTNWDSSLAFDIDANLNEVHRLTVTRRYCRVRFENTSASNQTFFRLQTLLGGYPSLTSPLNGLIQQDADAIVARTVESEVAIASGLFQGYSVFNKFGLNSDIDTGTVPEDIWAAGGTYTGWATAAETIQVFSSSTADTSAGTGARTVRIMGLDADYNSITETVTLNGTTPVTTVASFIRAHSMSVQSAGSGGVNAGTITARQSTTTANVFLTITPGVNQSYVSAYTVPAGHTAYMRRLHASVGTNAASNVEGYIWTRAFGATFRARRPFFVSSTQRLVDDIFGGLVFTEKSDIIVRISSVSANNTPVNGGYDLIVVKD